jgi:serine/threonine protein kinase
MPNGSIADHLPSAKNADMCQLRGDTRIAIIVVGIVLAMRYVHSKGIIHRNLTPTNVLLDWDWIVHVRGFSQCCLVNESPPPETSVEILSHSVGYRAPECYYNNWSPKSDIFSFGVILYELLVGEPAFSKTLTPYKYVNHVAIEKTRPVIPMSVLPFVRELIENCWSDDPDFRPSFESIFKILEYHDFKLLRRVNSLKVSHFVNEVRVLEAKSNEPPRRSRPLVKPYKLFNVRRCSIFPHSQ